MIIIWQISIEQIQKVEQSQDQFSTEWYLLFIYYYLLFRFLCAGAMINVIYFLYVSSNKQGYCVSPS